MKARRIAILVRMLAGAGLAVALGSTAAAEESDFLGSWLLYLDHRPAGFSYGTLEVEKTGEVVAAHIDGGPAPVTIDDDEITLLFDWDDGGGTVRVSTLHGSISDGAIPFFRR